MNEGQLMLMSSSMARTAPACCNAVASERGDIVGPRAKTTSPAAVTPTPERRT